MREAGLRRLRAATRAGVAGAVVLAGAFAGLAAASSPGRKHVQAKAAAAPPRRTPAVSLRVADPVPRPAPASDAPAPAPTPVATAAPVPAPVVTYSPPVVASGGS
jgi:hypothetical protein